MKSVRYLFLCFSILAALATYAVAERLPKIEIVKAKTWEKAMKNITSHVLRYDLQRRIIIVDDSGVLLDNQSKAIPKSYNIFYFAKHRKIPIFCLSTTSTAEQLREEGFRFSATSVSMNEDPKFSVSDGVICGHVNDNKVPGLALFLENVDFIPDQIIFIDDSFKNIEDMIDFCKNSGIDCLVINLILK